MNTGLSCRRRAAHYFVLALVATIAAGCSLEDRPTDTARVMPPVFGSNGDPDVAAINLSSWAFGRADTTHGDPADAARALAAVDYLAGELSTSPRWAGMTLETKAQMLAARTQIRNLLGVEPNAPSQLVVNALLQAGDAFAEHDDAAVRKVLRGPIFTLPPSRVMMLLEHLPYLGITNIATQNASGETTRAMGLLSSL